MILRLHGFVPKAILHRVWDSEMIDDTKLSYTELAESLRNRTKRKFYLAKKFSTRLGNGEYGIADQVYNYGNGKLGYKYTYQYFHIVRHRLFQAGIRSGRSVKRYLWIVHLD